jgi:signal peptidase I
VNAVPSHIASNNNSENRDISIITAVLESGNGVELPATGYSMFPTLLPGRRVIVKPLPGGGLPEPGNVIVYKDNDILVMHRLLKITADSNENLQFITRGDSRKETDKPWNREQFLGVAVSYKGNRKEHRVKSFIPPEWRYTLNRRVLWGYAMIRNVMGRSNGVTA